MDIPPYLTVVIPVYNEVENLPILHKLLHETLDGLQYSWEIILIDDGSSDGSVEVLEKLAASDPETVRLVEFGRNFGQTTAIAAGIDHAQGKVIILMDADLQNDPADIPMLMEKIEEGCDVVSGWRVKRQDNYLRRLPSLIANKLISWVTGVRLHDYGCTLKAYRREVITGFRLYGEMHRFIPVYARMVGAKILEVKVRHHPRRFGKTKYGLGRTIKVILDLFTVKFLFSYAVKPMYLFGGVGFSLLGFSFLLLLYTIIDRYFITGVHLNRNPLLTLSVLLFTMGFQSILMGLLAELMARTYHESQEKLTYTVKKKINCQ